MIYSMSFIYHLGFILIGIFLFFLLISIILSIRINRLRKQIVDLHIRECMHRKEERTRYQLLLDQIKKQPDKPRVMEDMQHIFDDRVSLLHRQYPKLTDLDIQVLILIGLGVENYEILTFTDMSKRTYYKRRQLIAQQMGTTAAQLNSKVQQIFAPVNT